jgi:HAD superfamily hydrolase (TIGR01662 family)
MKAVFFDANGVIYGRRARDHYLNAFLEQHQLQRPDARELSTRTEELHDAALRGAVPQEEYWNAILQACGVSDPAHLAEGRAAIQQDHGNIAIYPGVQETLQELKRRGFKIGIVTDAGVSKDTKLTWFREQGLDIHWDAYANSMDLKTRKPDVRMFQAALEEAGVSAGETVFVGHDARELGGARQAGLQTIAYNYDPDVEADTFIENFADLLDLPFLHQPA